MITLINLSLPSYLGFSTIIILHLYVNRRIYSFHILLVKKPPHQRRSDTDFINTTFHHDAEILSGHNSIIFPTVLKHFEVVYWIWMGHNFYRKIILLLCDFSCEVHQGRWTFSVDLLDDWDKAKSFVDINVIANTNKSQMKLSICSSDW